MSDHYSLTIDSVEVIDESQLLIIGSRYNVEMANSEVFYGKYDFGLAEYAESGVISGITDNQNYADPAATFVLAIICRLMQKLVLRFI